MLALLPVMMLSAAPLQVGVTLHPYYSWTANVAAGLNVQVVPVLPGEVDVGSYQPRPEDVKKLATLDALIINGIGHDDFIESMLRASGNTHCRVIGVNEGTALLKQAHGDAGNSHTFLSFSNAIAQTHLIARTLGELRPELRDGLQANAQKYVKRLRAQRAATVQRLSSVRRSPVITVHDGYSYFLQELGVELAGVVEPAHGLVPSAAELGEVVKLIESKRARVVLAEDTFPPGLAEVLKKSGASVTVISHIATGAFTPERFEQVMQGNVDALVQALGGAP